MAEAIWVALLLAVLAAGAVAVAWVIGIQPVQRTFVPRLRVSRTQRGQLNPVTTILLVIGVILIVYSVWLSDPVSALRTGTLFVAAAFLGYYMRFNRTRPAIIAFAVLVFGGFGLNLIHAVVYPDRLPLARAVLRDGQTIRGGFIAKDGSTWYLAVKDHKVLALDADQIARLTLSSRKQDGRASQVVASVSVIEERTDPPPCGASTIAASTNGQQL
jgi:hypothetical protein